MRVTSWLLHGQLGGRSRRRLRQSDLDGPRRSIKSCSFPVAGQGVGDWEPGDVLEPADGRESHDRRGGQDERRCGAGRRLGVEVPVAELFPGGDTCASIAPSLSVPFARANGLRLDGEVRTLAAGEQVTVAGTWAPVVDAEDVAVRARVRVEPALPSRPCWCFWVREAAHERRGTTPATARGTGWHALVEGSATGNRGRRGGACSRRWRRDRPAAQTGAPIDRYLDLDSHPWHRRTGAGPSTSAGDAGAVDTGASQGACPFRPKR